MKLKKPPTDETFQVTGKIIRFEKSTYLPHSKVTLSVCNVLDRTFIKSDGYEFNTDITNN